MLTAMLRTSSHRALELALAALLASVTAAASLHCSGDSGSAGGPSPASDAGSYGTIDARGESDDGVGGDGGDTFTIRLVDLTGRPLAPPAAPLRVHVGDADAVPDASGRVSLARPPTPYDAIVYSKGAAWVYRGLTRLDPTLMLPRQLSAARPGASVNLAPFDAGGGSELFAAVLGPAMGGDLAPVQTSEPFLDDPARGPTSRTIGIGFGAGVLSTELVAFAIDRVDGGVHYRDARQQPLSLAVDESFDWDLSGQSVAVADATLTTTVTSAAPLVLRRVFLETAGGSAWVIDDTAAAVGVASYTVPSAPGWNVMLCGASVRSASSEAHQINMCRHDVAPSAGTATLDIPEPPAIQSPASDAAVSRATPVVWSGPPESTLGVPCLLGEPTICVISTERSVVFPDLTDLGLPVRVGTAYGLWLNTFSIADVDTASGPAGLTARAGAIEVTSIDSGRHLTFQ